MSEIKHNKLQNTFTLDVNGDETRIEYRFRDGKMYLMHAFVPHKLRGKGVGQRLVLKTFEQLTKEGFTAVGVCSYIRAIAQRHPKWNSIIG